MPAPRATGGKDQARRKRPASPPERIDARCRAELEAPWDDLARKGWERVGDVIVLQFLPKTSLQLRKRAAAIAAQELGARCAVEDRGGIGGKLRTPKVRVLWGKGTRTVHLENGLRFAIDVAAVMLASGNQAERARAGALDCRGETVVDLFAGIGYFTVPLAARAGAKRVFACEKNPESFALLEENLRLNRIEDRVTPLLGDCRLRAPQGVADRVFLGYLHGTEAYLPTAVRALKREGGVLHYHEAYRQETKFRDAYAALSAACGPGFDLVILDAREVKSFAPGIDHVAVDARLVPRVKAPGRLAAKR
jgi:tRNA wybutosine-synthesizing protein 2